MTFLLILACGRGSEPPASELEDMGPFADIGGAESPDWSPDELQENVAMVLDSGMPNPRNVRNLYASFMGLRDDQCPTFEAQDPAVWAGVWDADCTTSGGVGFFGNALYFETEEAGFREIEMVASFELIASETDWYIGGGEYKSTWSTTENERFWDLYLGGTFQSPGGSTWMQQRGESSLFVNASADDGGVYSQIDGGIGWDKVAISFHQMVLNSRECDGMPMGTLFVRDPSQHWFEIAMVDCSGCGELYWREAHQGNVCLGAHIRDAWENMWGQKTSWEEGE